MMALALQKEIESPAAMSDDLPESLLSPEAIRQLFESAWRAGTRPKIEDSLAKAPSGSRVDLFADLLSLELSYRNARRESFSKEEYISRFPHAANQVDHVFNNESTAGARDTDEDSTLSLPRGARPDRSFGATSEGRETPADPGAESFQDYELLGEIARGGMGVVYRAVQKQANRVVALKMILSGAVAGEAEVRRFRNEAKAAAGLDHPNIVPVFDVGERNGQPYFTMGFVEGESLAAKTRNGPMPTREAAELVEVIADAIGYAHRKGVIHRDLKPSNVLLDKDGNPRITDFGLAKQVAGNDQLTATGQVMGTPSFMPPEQARGDLDNIDERSDVYSLGAMLYCLITGRPPFQSASVVDTLKRVLDEPPLDPRTINPAIDRDLATICLKCLEKTSSRRYESAQALTDELRRYLDGNVIHARPVSRWEHLARWCRRKPIEASLIATVAMVLILGTVISGHFALRAEQKAALANRRKNVAIKTLEKNINYFQEQLKSIPQARDLRREMLRESLSGLEMISEQLRSETQIDRNTAISLAELARLFYEIGDDEGEGALSAAESNYLEAARILDQIIDPNESDYALLKDQAWVQCELGNFYLNQYRTTQARPHLREALRIRRQIDEAKQDATSLYQLCFSLSDWGDLKAETQQFADAIPFYQEAIDRIDDAVNHFPDDQRLRIQLIRCHEKIGDAYHDLRRNEEAYAHFQTCLQLTEMLPNEYLGGESKISALGFAYERLGNHWLQVGQAEKALAMYEKMRAASQQAIQADPANRILKSQLSMAYWKLADAYRALEQTEEANKAEREGNRLQAELTESPIRPKS